MFDLCNPIINEITRVRPFSTLYLHFLSSLSNFSTHDVTRWNSREGGVIAVIEIRIPQLVQHRITRKHGSSRFDKLAPASAAPISSCWRRARTMYRAQNTRIRDPDVDSRSWGNRTEVTEIKSIECDARNSRVIAADRATRRRSSCMWSRRNIWGIKCGVNLALQRESFLTLLVIAQNVALLLFEDHICVRYSLELYNKFRILWIGYMCNFKKLEFLYVILFFYSII